MRTKSKRGGSDPCGQGCLCGKHNFSTARLEIVRQGVLKGWQYSDRRAKFSVHNPGRNPSEETRHRMKIARQIRAPASQVTRDKMSREATQRWAEDDGTWRRALVRGLHRQGPNKPESKLLRLAVEWNFQFNGRGPLVIGGVLPDLWDGGTQLLEVYGDYWHRDQDPQDRIDLFKRYGYNCLVIWEHELSDPDEVKQRLSRFVAEGEDGE